MSSASATGRTRSSPKAKASAAAPRHSPTRHRHSSYASPPPSSTARAPRTSTSTSRHQSKRGRGKGRSRGVLLTFPFHLPLSPLKLARPGGSATAGALLAFGAQCADCTPGGDSVGFGESRPGGFLSGAAPPPFVQLLPFTLAAHAHAQRSRRARPGRVNGQRLEQLSGRSPGERPPPPQQT